jgi:hypothetical protein
MQWGWVVVMVVVMWLGGCQTLPEQAPTADQTPTPQITITWHRPRSDPDVAVPAMAGFSTLPGDDATPAAPPPSQNRPNPLTHTLTTTGCYPLPNVRLLCLGMLVNQSDATLAGPRVQVRLRGDDGVVLAEATTALVQRAIAPAEQAPFHVIFAAPPAWESVEAGLLPAVGTGAPLIDLAVQVRTLEAGPQAYRAELTITNPADHPVGESRLTVALLDGEGNPATYRTYILDQALAPGASVTRTVVLQPLTLADAYQPLAWATGLGR